MTESGSDASFEELALQIQQEETSREDAVSSYKLRAQLEKKNAAIRNMQRELRGARDDIAALQTDLDLYGEDFSKKPNWLRSKKKVRKEHRGTLVLVFSDAHYGEVVRPAELGGYNKYNLDIAELRTQALFEKTIMLARNYLAGVKYDGIVLAMLGDMVSGDIHKELEDTNEASTYRTVEITTPWIARGIEMFAEEFGNVHVVSAPGNHGRDYKVPRHKKRSEHNADTHIARILSQIIFKDAANITFDVPESSDVDFQVYDSIFSAEHGDNLKFNGTSEIGSLGPVKRGNLRKTKKRQEQGRPFRYGIYGHFHQYVPAYSQGFIMNGSLKGYDEYASNGQFTPEPAQQALLLVTPEHGITQAAQVIVTNRKQEGW